MRFFPNLSCGQKCRNNDNQIYECNKKYYAGKKLNGGSYIGRCGKSGKP